MEVRTDWTLHEEQLLIEAWAERADQIREQPKNLHVYDDLRLELEEYDCKFSVEEIKIKIHNLTVKYRKEKSESGSQSRWTWHSKIHDILKKYDDKELLFAKPSAEIVKVESKRKSNRHVIEWTSDDESFETRSHIKDTTQDKPKTELVNEETDTKPRRSNWMPEEERLLLEVWRDHIDELTSFKKTRTIYERMQSVFEENNCGVTVDELIVKVHNFSSRYRKDRLLYIQSGGKKKSQWKFYDEIHSFLGKRLSDDKIKLYHNRPKKPDIDVIVANLNTSSASRTNISQINNIKNANVDNSCMDDESRSDDPRMDGCSDEEHAENQKMGRKKRALWLLKQEKYLLKAWVNRLDELQKRGKHMHIYEDIRLKMRTKNFIFTADEIRFKIHNIRERYRKAILEVGSSGQAPSKWALFWNVHKMLWKYEENNYDDEVRKRINNLAMLNANVEDSDDESETFEKDETLHFTEVNRTNICQINALKDVSVDNSCMDYESRSDDPLMDGCSDEEHAENQKMGRKKRAFWFLKQEKYLLKAWANRLDELQKRGKHMHIYEDIRLKMRRKNYKYTTDEIRFKIHNIRERYRKTILQVGSSEQSQTNWALFWNVHKMLWKYEEHNYDDEMCERINNLAMLDANVSDSDDESETFIEKETLKNSIVNQNSQTNEDVIKNSTETNILNDVSSNPQDTEFEENLLENQITEVSNRKPRSKWGSREDKILVEAWAERIDVIKKRQNVDVYEDIQDVLEKNDCYFTVVELRNKIHNFTQRYRKEIPQIVKKEKPSDWPLFWEIHRFLWSREKKRFSHNVHEMLENLAKSNVESEQQSVNRTRAIWTLQEEKMLIQVWSKKLSQLQKRQNRHIYEEIQSELTLQQFCNVSLKEVINKMHNLKCRYRKEKNSLPSDWPLYDEMENLLEGFCDGDAFEDDVYDSTCASEQLEDYTENPETPDTLEVNKLYLCRICMQDEPISDWNEELLEFNGISYKDCYYKYTQLQEIDSDPLPQFLCKTCLAELQTIHIFIQKALDTQQFLQTKLSAPTDILAEQDMDEDETHDSQNVYMDEEADIKLKIHNDDFDSSYQLPHITKKVTETNNILKENEEDYKQFEHVEFHDNTSQIQTKIDIQRHIPNQKTSLKKVKQTRSSRHLGRICSYCSKICGSVYKLRIHELTHQRNRKPEAICPICGIKLLNKSYFREHLNTHDQNREKRFKCEYCEKAFYSRPALYTHRKLHLGKMVKCPQCPKEYFTQPDLDRHMQKHSITPLHSAKPKIKYVVHCKECNKDINSDLFKEHRAIHRNEPQMRCTVCEKDFFGRCGYSQHMKAVHNRKVNDWDDITFYYMRKRPRLSHKLLLEQEVVKPKPIPQ